MNQNAVLISLVAGSLIPVVTGLATKLQAPAMVKSLVALAVAALVGVLTQIQQTGAFDWQQSLMLFAAAFG